MKRILIILLIITSYAYSLDKEELERRSAKSQLDTAQKIIVLIINGETELAEELVVGSYKEGSYNYHFYLAYVAEANEEYDIALNNYIEAKAIDNRVEVDLALIDIYIKMGQFDEAEELLLNLQNSNIDTTEIDNIREEISELRKGRSFFDISLNTFYTDNLYEDKDKVGSFGNGLEVDYGRIKYLNRVTTLKYYIVYANEYNYEDRDENYNYLFLGASYDRKKGQSLISFPVEVDYKMKDSERDEYNLSLGFEYKKFFTLEKTLSYRGDISYKNNNLLEFDGYVQSNKLSYTWKNPFEIDYRLRLKFDLERFDKDQYSINTYAYDFRLNRSFGKNRINLLLSLDYETYSESDREDLFERYSLFYERYISNNGWKLKLDYTLEVQDSNIDSFDYEENIFSFVVSKEY